MVPLGHVVTVGAVVVVLAACTQTPPQATGGESADAIAHDVAFLDDFDEARERWEAASLDSYRLTVDMRCLCPVLGPLVIQVEQGTASIVRAPEDAVPADLEAMPWTVDEAFDFLAPFVDADGFNVAYDQVSGHPISADIDPVAGTADDEFRLYLDVAAS